MLRCCSCSNGTLFSCTHTRTHNSCTRTCTIHAQTHTWLQEMAPAKVAASKKGDDLASMQVCYTPIPLACCVRVSRWCGVCVRCRACMPAAVCVPCICVKVHDCGACMPPFTHTQTQPHKNAPGCRKRHQQRLWHQRKMMIVRGQPHRCVLL
jgi:hypothetical protein